MSSDGHGVRRHWEDQRLQALLGEEAEEKFIARVKDCIGGHDNIGDLEYDSLRLILREHIQEIAGDQLPPRCDGASLIAAERRRQVEAEDWTPEHDDEHDDFELCEAAAAYALYAGAGPTKQAKEAEELWPFEDGWNPSEDEVRNLVKAGALVAAEIDRLQRAASTQQFNSTGSPRCERGEDEQDDALEILTKRPFIFDQRYEWRIVDEPLPLQRGVSVVAADASGAGIGFGFWAGFDEFTEEMAKAVLAWLQSNQQEGR